MRFIRYDIGLPLVELTFPDDTKIGFEATLSNGYPIEGIYSYPLNEEPRRSTIGSSFYGVSDERGVKYLIFPELHHSFYRARLHGEWSGGEELPPVGLWKLARCERPTPSFPPGSYIIPPPTDGRPNFLPGGGRRRLEPREAEGYWGESLRQQLAKGVITRQQFDAIMPAPGLTQEQYEASLEPNARGTPAVHRRRRK
jgi:hypothetical protein